MFRDKPLYKYCGLTIVLSHPSRFDKMSKSKVSLLNAGAGRLVDEFLAPEFNRYQCDIRLYEDKEPLLDGTKCVLLCGESAYQLRYGKDNSLGEIRGSPLVFNGVDCICSWYPQDAVDPKDFEGQFNAEDSFDDNEYEGETEDDKESAVDGKRRHGRTKRRNFRFWLQQDINKCKYIIKYGNVPVRPFEPKYHLHLSSNDILNILMSNQGRRLFLDLETFIPTPDIKCVGFSFDSDCDVYVFPVYDYRNTWAYSNVHQIIRALAICMSRNITIAHNGKCFDFPVLCWKNRIPLTPKLEDTMIMMHRMYSEVERSLGHIVSLFTYEKFHKDLGNVGYHSMEQQRQTMQYCGIDVFAMKLCYYEMIRRAEKIPGMIDSFKIANAAIYPYLLSEMTGIHFKEEIRQAKLKENDRWMMQYIRMAKYLVGEDNWNRIRGKGKSSLLASAQQCVKYFHDELGYSVVGRGKVTVKGTRNPSLGKKNIYKLRLKNENPVIDLVLNYRETAKESGTLKFNSWDFNNPRLENLSVSDEDTDEEGKHIAEQFNLPV